MPAHRKRFLYAMPVGRTILRGIGRVHGDQNPTSFFRFVGQDMPELQPSGIRNAFDKITVMNHGLDMQRFYSDEAIAVDDAPGVLMHKIMPPVADALVDTSDDLAGFRIGS